MLLSKNNKFVEEFNQFVQKIEKIENESTKKELLSLLSELNKEVKSIDQLHQNLTVGIKPPTDMGGHREKIQNIRKRLIERLERY